MKVFLSSLENGQCCFNGSDGKRMESAYYLIEQGVRYKWNLMSFFYIGKKKYKLAEFIRDHSEEILIDSGAHSFQKGAKVKWDEYTQRYAEFIKRFDRPNVIGYFEMDVDNIIGYDKVLELRAVLERVSDKIIPVWHKNRGIPEYQRMCQQYSGKIVAITGFKNEDIRDEQYMMFLKYAKRFNCKVHCLGMTRRKVLDKVPFDYVDSSTWKQHGIYGMIEGRGKVTRDFYNTRREVLFLENYKSGIRMQNHYYAKWRSVCGD